MHSLSTEGNKTPYQLFFEGLRCDNTSTHDAGNASNHIELESNDPVCITTNIHGSI